MASITRLPLCLFLIILTFAIAIKFPLRVNGAANNSVCDSTPKKQLCNFCLPSGNPHFVGDLTTQALKLVNCSLRQAVRADELIFNLCSLFPKNAELQFACVGCHGCLDAITNTLSSAVRNMKAKLFSDAREDVNTTIFYEKKCILLMKSSRSSIPYTILQALIYYIGYAMDANAAIRLLYE